MTTWTHEQLKTRQRAIRDQFPESLGLRAHRALSWLKRAEKEGGDDDARFIFLWIAFNAAYANDLSDRAAYSEKGMFIGFLQKLIEMDKEQLIYNLLWSKYSSSIRLLLENKYVFQPFWDHLAGIQGNEDWADRFEKSKGDAFMALSRKDSLRVLRLVLERLYVLRNQLVHGGSTWDSQVNREQMRDGARFMGDLVPLVIHLMMDHPEQLWGMPSYPVIKA